MPYRIKEVETQKTVDIVCHRDWEYQDAKYEYEVVSFKNLTMDEKCLLIEDIAQRIDTLSEKSNDFENEIRDVRDSIPSCYDFD